MISLISENSPQGNSFYDNVTITEVKEKRKENRIFKSWRTKKSARIK